mgnify:CR=1 FL=1
MSYFCKVCQKSIKNLLFVNAASVLENGVSQFEIPVGSHSIERDS